MDDLHNLKDMRSNFPPPTAESKERLWVRLEAEMDSSGVGTSSGRSRFSRLFKKAVVGAGLLILIAISPVGTAVANRVEELFGSENYATSVTSPETRQAVDTMDREMRAYFENRPKPEGTYEERTKVMSAALDKIAQKASIATSGESEPIELPPGVVIRVSPEPLAGIDREKDAAFCAKVAKELAARGLPEDHTCDLQDMVQDGELPPGDYTQAQIDRLFGADDAR